MKLLFFSLVILATSVLWFSCKQTKYTADKLSDKQIRWGTGGGFVGKESAQILCDNGQIFNRDIMGTVLLSGKTKGKKAKTLFKTAEELGLAKLEYNHPGNIYYFIELLEGDMVSRVVWGDKKYPVEKSINDLFEELNGLLKQ
ncbi:MAG: hypothetical protein ACKVT2_15280 [Saprospiraceae bacterium]